MKPIALNTPQDIAATCRFLGIETGHKSFQELQIECWQAVAATYSAMIEELLNRLEPLENPAHTDHLGLLTR